MRSTRTPVWQSWSAERTLTRGQALVLVTVVCVCAAAGLWWPALVGTVWVSACTVVFIATAACRAWYYRTALGAAPEQRPQPTPHGDWPLYSVLVSLYKEAEVVPELF